MRVLVGCEFSGVVRDAFRRLGHYAVSCDLLPSETVPGIHLKMDVLLALDLEPWDLAIFHPPCTRLTVAGARWFKGREQEQAEAIAFVEKLWNCGIPRLAIENPDRRTQHEVNPRQTDADHSALAVRTRGGKGYLSVAQEPPKARADEHRRGSSCASSQRTALAGSLEEQESDVSRNRGGNGRAMGAISTRYQ
jgi:hypothetical protein